MIEKTLEYWQTEDPEIVKQRRLDIVKDAIYRLNTHQFALVEKEYWTLASPGEILNQETINGPEFTCYVCAAGALLLSAVGLFNSLELDVSNGCTAERLRNPWISGEQLALIELAFEGPTRDAAGWPLEELHPIAVEARSSAIDFYHKYADPECRTLAIFKNMLANDGIFKP